MHENYIEENPWHNKAKEKPIFSLGAPLPHQVRGPGKSKLRKGDTSRENLAEQGELGRVESAAVRAQSLTRDDQEKRSRRTAAGVSHGGKTNDAGQPVFDYIPSRTAEPTAPGPDTEPDFKIDSEPLGRRQRSEMDPDGKNHDHYRNRWTKIRARYPEPLAEFLAVSFSLFPFASSAPI
jgi:aquaglyceroporin related protein, other eukaryote